MVTTLKFSLLLLITLTSHYYSDDQYKYADLNLNNGEKVTGQLINEYYEKWFWEKDHKNVYLAIFTEDQIKFVNLKNISKRQYKTKRHSNYHNFLNKHSLYFTGAPLKGENYISTGNQGHHLDENMYGNFAWDFVRKENRKMFKNFGKNNQDFYVWGSQIFSPIQGVIADIERDEFDHAPDSSNNSDISNRSHGNFVLLHLYENFYASFLHLQKSSIPKHLTIGSAIKVGDLLGKVGNSGITYVPHLHLTMYYWSAELNRMVSVPTFFNNIKTTSLNIKFKTCGILPKTDQKVYAVSQAQEACK